jgi:hypothetical protein
MVLLRLLERERIKAGFGGGGNAGIMTLLSLATPRIESEITKAISADGADERRYDRLFSSAMICEICGLMPCEDERNGIV